MEEEQKLFSALADNVQWLRLQFMPSEDLYIKNVDVGGVAGALCIFEGLSDLERLWVMAGQAMSQLPPMEPQGDTVLNYLLTKTVIPLDKTVAATQKQVVRFLTAGAAVLLLDDCSRALVISSQGQQFRSVSEPSGEGNLRGSHEGFVELLRINISLLRRLVRSPKLHCEIQIVGRTTRTETALLYHSEKCSPDMVEKVKACLKRTGLDMLFDPGYLAPFVVRTPFSLFTPAGFTERPDTAAAKLCEGKMVLLVNGSPYAMVLPHFFCEHFQSMDDYLQRPYFSGFIRLLKYTAFFISVVLPGAFVAVAEFTPEMLSSALLYKLAAAQMTTPLPLFWEMLIVNVLLEVIREAGLRLPKSIGHAVSLVAALIVGDAAVQIGLLGTPVLVICALAGLCSYVVPSLYEPGIVLRMAFLLAGGIAGPAGMAMLGCLCLLDICRPSPFGIPYTAPVTPYSSALWRDGLLRASWRSLTKKRPFGLRSLPRKKEAAQQKGKSGGRPAQKNASDDGKGEDKK